MDTIRLEIVGDTEKMHKLQKFMDDNKIQYFRL